MGTINTAFNLISGALDADQAALSIVANNVANANTPGYTQEMPTWQERDRVNIGGVLTGDGVAETGAQSLRDRVLEQRLDQQQQLAASSGARLTALNSLQAVFPPDSGSGTATAGDIGNDITSFFSSFASLEANPSDNSLREEVLSSATTLAADISGAATSLNAQRSALDQQASGVTAQVNTLTTAIAQLNQQIETTSPQTDAGTLEDQRQQDLSQLSQLVGINQITTQNNGISVTTASGALLVSENHSYQMTNGMVGGVTHFFVGTSDITTQLTTGGGELGGFLTARDQDIPGALSALDWLAYGIATGVNAQNNAGTDLDGVTGTVAAPLNIFGPSATLAGSAAAMSVTMTDPGQIAAAAAGAGTGDNSNAAAMAALGKTALVSGQTPTDFFSGLVSTLGSTVSGVQAENTAQNASVSQLQTQNDALSDVNLNDEASAMAVLQTSYQAASQVFNLLNTIMTSALNLGEETTVT
jgi:flagellar hook-associated protein 1 FlgK